MPYSLSKTNGTLLTIVQDGTIDTTTDLVFIGKNYAGYGDPVNENFVRLLENFANITAPIKPLEGQLWFDTSVNKLKLFYNTRFKPLAVLTTGTSTPSGPNPGDLHFNGNLLYVFNSRDWLPIGPLTTSGQSGTVQLPTTTVIAEDQSIKSVIDIGIDTGSATVISTSSAFGVYTTQDLYSKYNAVYPGINLPDTDEDGVSGYYDSGSNLGNFFWGTAGSAIGLVDYSNSVKRLVRVSELATKAELGQFNTDDGITINNVFKLHVTRSGGIAAANVSNISNNVIRFNIKTDQGISNFLSFDATSGAFRVVPNTSTSVTLGSPDTGGSFSTGYIADLINTNLSSTAINATRVTGGDARFTNLTATNRVEFTNGITIGTTSTIAGSRIWTTSTLNNNNQLINGAGYLTSATVVNYNVASVRGTTNQINVSSTTGNVTFSLPERVSINTLTTTYISSDEIFVNGSRVLTEFTAPTSGINFINGTANQIVATTSIGGGTVTLSLPSSVQVSSVVASSLFDSGSRVLTAATGVTSFSGGSTGLTPFGANTGAITLGGTLLATSGGTGFSSYAIGDILYAGTTQALAKLTAVAPGRVLVSNGVGVAPKYDKVDLTVHVAGTLPISNGGTNATTPAQALANLGGEPAFPSGTKMIFAQPSAPTGWTSISINDAALRVVSGGPGGTGGTFYDQGKTAFSSIFASRPVTGTVGGTTLTADQMPSHNHFMFVAGSVGNIAAVSGASTVSVATNSDPGESEYIMRPAAGTPGSGITGNTGGGQSHTHSFTGNSLDFAVKYVDVIVAQKN